MHKIRKVVIGCGITALIPQITIPLTSCSPKLMEAKTIDGFDWEGVTGGGFDVGDYVVDEKNQTITYTNGSKLKGNNIVIPNYVSWLDKTYKVILGEGCFANNEMLTGSVETNIFFENIATKCFYNVHNITTVIFNIYPRDVGDYAFAQCSSLHKMYIKQNGQLYDKSTIKIHKLGAFAFYQCPLDQSNWLFGPSLTWVGESAFAQCSAINSVDLRLCGTLNEIPVNMFSGCKKLTEVYFPEHISKINDRAFAGCGSLMLINLPVDNVSLQLGDSVFENCTNFLDFSKPYSISLLGKSCFKGVLNFTTTPWSETKTIDTIPMTAFENTGFVTIKFYPNCVSNIEDRAFYGCKQLRLIDFSSFSAQEKRPQWTGENVFADDDKTKKGQVILPSGLTEQDRQLWKNFLTRQGVGDWEIIAEEKK